MLSTPGPSVPATHGAAVRRWQTPGWPCASQTRGGPVPAAEGAARRRFQTRTADGGGSAPRCAGSRRPTASGAPTLPLAFSPRALLARSPAARCCRAVCGAGVAGGAPTSPPASRPGSWQRRRLGGARVGGCTVPAGSYGSPPRQRPARGPPRCWQEERTREGRTISRVEDQARQVGAMEHGAREQGLGGPCAAAMAARQQAAARAPCPPARQEERCVVACERQGQAQLRRHHSQRVAVNAWCGRGGGGRRRELKRELRGARRREGGCLRRAAVSASSGPR